MPGPDPALVSQRLFFALWPEPPLADCLFELAGNLARQCGGRVTGKDSLHMTLAFLGEVPLSRLPTVLEAGESLALPGFEFELDQLGGWKHNKIVWAGIRQAPDALIRLADALRLALAARGLSLDGRPFAPHVTLLRKATVARALAPLPPLRWRAAQVVLVASPRRAAGAPYQRLAAWPLERGLGENALPEEVP